MLTKSEQQIFSLLLDGKTYSEASYILGKTAANVHVVCSRIRKKTKLPDLKPETCRAWDRKNRFSLKQKERGPTPREREVLWALSQGFSNHQISEILGVKPGTIMVQACSGRKRAGIKDTLRASLVTWFEQDKLEQERINRLIHKEHGHLNGDPCF